MKNEQELEKEYNKLIGKMIQYERIKKGWSVQELANSANIDRSFLGKVEHGDCGISQFRLYKVAAALGLKDPNQLSIDAKIHIFPKVQKILEEMNKV